ncbi:MAG: hypothetical protein LBO08_00040 [Rickettsiales bacterium]|jgi:DnaK suppressor protein|nr:hypothetical protein [Rickettsiales bacterium]
MSAVNYKTLELPKGYAPKKTEQYMCVQQRAYFYGLLNAQRAGLQAEIDAFVASIKESVESGNIGANSDDDKSAIEQTIMEQSRMQNRALQMIAQIDAALERLSNGSFGYSVISGDEIGLKRLMVRPTTTMTMEERENYENKV